jgi:glucose uptake protein GlcU
MLYRSPFTRLVLAGVGLLVGVVFTFGSAAKWRSTPSLHWLEQAPVPLQAWGVLFIVYALLLPAVRTRPFGYALGAFLFAVFTLSLLATLDGPDPKNIVTLGAMADTVVFHVYSIRTAEYQKLSR